DESEFFFRITTEDEELRMPPTKAGKRLKPDQVNRIQRWIEQGAVWKGHWAYLPLSRQDVPADAAADPSLMNPIDRFIRAGLVAEGLDPPPQPKRAPLIRRLSLDLVGLPPPPAELDAFVQDTHPDAYEHLVDRLLTSPHYGERMAVFWLDLVR